MVSTVSRSAALVLTSRSHSKESLMVVARKELVILALALATAMLEEKHAAVKRLNSVLPDVGTRRAPRHAASTGNAIAYQGSACATETSC